MGRKLRFSIWAGYRYHIGGKANHLATAIGVLDQSPNRNGINENACFIGILLFKPRAAQRLTLHQDLDLKNHFQSGFCLSLV